VNRLFGADETPKTAPIKEGEEYEVKIEDLGKEGDGITRIEGFVVFVPETKVGEEIKVRINAVRRSFAFAEKITE
jgi:predicted RNA-binding protein with TRAM domain